MKTILWGILLISTTLQARLNIEITQGMAGGVPIAVTPSLQEPAGNASFEALASVIRNDLRMCGRFEPLPPEKLAHFKSFQQQMNAQLWQKMKVENVVLGEVKASGDQYTVSFRLLDVYKTPEGADSAATLSAQTFSGISSQHFRALAHHISDLVYEKLTGIRGAFSTRIAYIMVQDTLQGKQYSLEIADADGFNPRTLVKSKEPLMSPSWSADGRRLAFVSFEKNRAEIYIIEVASGRRELLSKFQGINGAPAWSPDGHTLALVLSKDGSPKIYLMDLASRQLTQLTEGYAIDTEPTWSRDGRTIYFTSNRGGKPQIYRIDITSKKTDRVTFVGNYNARPMLSPDGKHLVMMHRQERSDQFHIASQELATGQVSVLTHAGLDESPTLSPNGAMVLYSTQANDRQILGLVTLDGRGQLRLPAREGSVQEPAWSPFLS